MKSLIDIYSKLSFGDIVLYQEEDAGVYSQPKLVCIIGIDVWDMACAVHFIDYKMFEAI